MVETERVVVEAALRGALLRGERPEGVRVGSIDVVGALRAQHPGVDFHWILGERAGGRARARPDRALTRVLLLAADESLDWHDSRAPCCCDAGEDTFRDLKAGMWKVRSRPFARWKAVVTCV